MHIITTKPANGTTRKFRLSIVQLILLATGIAALLAWSLQDRTRELVWLESTLKYEAPPVPKSYTNMPLSNMNGLVFYASGTDLFISEHLNGWQAYRYHFYRDYDLANDKFELRKELEDIDISRDGTGPARALVYATGYNDCRDQINQLLLSHSSDDLRGKLARKKADSLPILLIAVGCLSVFIVTMIRKPKPKALS